MTISALVSPQTPIATWLAVQLQLAIQSNRVYVVMGIPHNRNLCSTLTPARNLFYKEYYAWDVRMKVINTYKIVLSIYLAHLV